MSAVILVVEDDATVRTSLATILERSGYQVYTAPDGETAIVLLGQYIYDVVVTDMRMRGVDGVEVLQAAMRRSPPPSVLMLTGYGTLDTAIAALRAGAQDYLLKPCSPQVLLESVARALERRTSTMRQVDTIRTLAQGVAQLQRQLLNIEPPEGVSEPPAPDGDTGLSDHLVIGGLHIGHFPHETRYNEQAVHVTPIEHALLRCLAEAGGHIVSYSEIVRRTHGYAAGDSEAQALLKTHVRNLRRKIGADLITNVRNVGYQLDLTIGARDQECQ